MKIDMNVKNI